jgi:hypothetical protein
MNQTTPLPQPARAATKSAEENAATLEALHAAFPQEGLFADKEWLISPRAVPSRAEAARGAGKLGLPPAPLCQGVQHALPPEHHGRQPAWIAEYLDRGKPPELVEFSRQKAFRKRPPESDAPGLVLTDEGSRLRNWIMSLGALASPAG